MENQHKKIKGYRDLTQEEVDLMNEIKEIGENVGKLCDKLKKSMKFEEESHGTSDAPMYDQRWINIGKTHLQQGFMALVRSVSKPESF